MTSLRRLLLITALPLVTGVALAAALIGYLGSHHEAEELMDAQMTQYARLLARTLPRGGSRPEGPSEGGYVHDYEARLTFQYWINDQLVTRSRYGPTLTAPPATSGFRNLETTGGDWRVFTLALPTGARVVVAEDEQVRAELALALAGEALVPTLISIPLIGGVLVLVVNVAVRRIDAIAAAVGERSSHDLTPVPTEQAPKELTRLLMAINGLLERLRAGLEREKQFSADAAHELRTPITGIRIHLQNARLSPPDDPDLQESVERAESGLSRMADIVEQLLEFSRAVNTDERTGSVPLDLAEILREAADTQRHLLERQSQHIELSLEPAVVHGNGELLAIVFANLIRNASQYAPQGSTIAVGLHRHGEGAVATVEDAGPGISADRRARALARFHRGGAGADDTASGSGLGLAIAERICDRHGAVIELGDSERMGGLEVRVRFGDARSGHNPDACGPA